MGVEGNLGNGNNDGVAPKMTLADSESKGQVPPLLAAAAAGYCCCWLLHCYWRCARGAAANAH